MDQDAIRNVSRLSMVNSSLSGNTDFNGIDTARLFLAFMFVKLAVALNCRSLTHSIFKAKPHKLLLLTILWETLLLSSLISLPFIRDAFRIVLPTLHDIALVIGVSLAVLLSLELIKHFQRRCRGLV